MEFVDDGRGEPGDDPHGIGKIRREGGLSVAAVAEMTGRSEAFIRKAEATGVSEDSARAVLAKLASILVTGRGMIVALLLAMGLALGAPAMAGEPESPPGPPSKEEVRGQQRAEEFCRVHPNGCGQVTDGSCVGNTRHVDCDGERPGLTYCGYPIAG